MTNPFIRKLNSFSDLSLTDKKLLEQSTAVTRHFQPRTDIKQESDEVQSVSLIVDGWACRYKLLEDGRRQIISFFLPGDMCDPYVFMFRSMDQSIGALTPITVTQIPHQSVRAMTAHSNALAEALWWDMQVFFEIQREWTVSLGRRTALERLAHLLCEFSVRLQRVSLNDGAAFEMPITQADLGDAMGLSTVHVNRSLQELRSAGLIVLRGKRMTIIDEVGLRNLAMFNPDYLHVPPRRESPARLDESSYRIWDR